MKIVINGEEIPVEIENEKNAYDVVVGLSEYLGKLEQQQFVVSVSINGKEFSYADEKGLKDTTIDKIGLLELETSDVVGVSILSLKQISLYLDFIAVIVEKNIWDDSLIKVADSLEWMKQGLDQIATLFGKSIGMILPIHRKFCTRFDMITGLFKDIIEDSFPLESDFKSEIEFTLKDIKGLLDEIINVISSSSLDRNKGTGEKIDDVIKMLDELIPELNKVPVLFQSGNDRKAMDNIQCLANTIESSISLFVFFRDNLKIYIDKYTVNDKSFEEFFTTITGNLRELMTAMGNNDSVMMGDLVEYEFIPNIVEIRNLLIKIKEETFVSVN